MLPLIKWAGGKRKFVSQISDLLGDIQGTYFEPFLGGAALLLHLQPAHAYCSDINPELINFYNTVKYNVDELIASLEHDFISHHSKEFYYSVRDWERDEELYSSLSSVKRAARFIYLNKTCYNGVWRVNGNGFFNVPFGRYKTPTFPLPGELREASAYFNESVIEFRQCGYQELAAMAHAGDVVYFDPPYDVEVGQSEFVKYTSLGFDKDDQIALKHFCDNLIDRGVKVGISNSNTDFIRSLYVSDRDRKYVLNSIKPFSRTIGRTVESRRLTTELFILGTRQ